MLLLDPKNHTRPYPDESSREVMLKLIEFFEGKGKEALKRDDREQTWYGDFLDFVKSEKGGRLPPPSGATGVSRSLHLR